ncbi:hypothetical protein BKA82DRAFT_1006804 [Pisolithus tinctorius]|uniref:Uncharacterized protein n=1 Tax=Pisolithus tinctorius Marx 270 TaxID=870435 RepID=A0A0C3NER7_PISTI|nr:hypothetical protein BKA82DRAFT_1006804 [Pisolithus tinctorius]KIN96298.1 hypothetical protein M404DRAFT_1006804 [Pisolithus tinctorius Marx 270]KIN99579.1 hypothetical protein M404DRAFT_1004524 [Pisolithus tinctorius Marx 270]
MWGGERGRSPIHSVAPPPLHSASACLDTRSYAHVSNLLARWWLPLRVISVRAAARR